jgi:hypothetical protein
MSRGIESFLEKLRVLVQYEQTERTDTNLVHSIKIVLESDYTDCAEIIMKYFNEGVEKGECDERIRW